jgi:hypothetical protein
LRRVFAMALLLTSALLARGSLLQAQVQLDVCGCANNPASLGDFDTANLTAAQQLLLTTSAFRAMEFRLPPDGVMVFNSLNLRPRGSDAGALTITFTRNAANTPVTLLVAGDVNIASSVTINIGGDDGVTGSTNTLGRGGVGGPGGFRGGDGAYQLVNFATGGGAGLGPAAGAGATNVVGVGNAGNGNFVGTADLLPIIGGSGGGGGDSTSTASACAGGGGGGGGGAMLLAANGTITLSGSIIADGGTRGIESSSSCASRGGGGSGGAVRILATTLQGAGTVYARGGTGGVGNGGNGSIRLEALNNTLNVSSTTPIAARTAGPGPIANVITPSVAITSVGGQTVPANPQGVYGAVDIVLPVPGVTSVGFSTSGVPVGTTVNVTVKPRVGGAPLTTPTTLTNCDGTGACLANVSFDLQAGSYFVEARATFQTP